MVAMTSGFVRPVPKNRSMPVHQLVNYILLALRYIAPYTLPIGALACFVYAGFLAGTVVGFVVLGICLLAFQYWLELTRGE